MIISGRCVPYTIPSGDEYALLRKAMALYAKYGYKSDDATISKIALEIGRTYKTTKQMITGGVRNMMFTEFYRQYADEDGEEGAEDVTVDTTTEPSRMFYHERRLKIRKRLFGGQNMLSVQVAVHHSNSGGISVESIN